MLTRKDYLYVAIIGACFAIFAVPIISNVAPSVPLTFVTVAGLIGVMIVFAMLAMWVSSLIARVIPVFLQLAKFAAVGAFNTFLDWGVLNVLIAITALAAGWWYWAFKSISFIVSTGGSYLWNRTWTFGVSQKISGKESGKFFAVSVVGWLINSSIASVVVNFVAIPGGLTPRVWANVGAAIATLASLVWNFIGYKFFVFASEKNSGKQIVQ